MRQFDATSRIRYSHEAGWSSLVARRAHNAPNANRLSPNCVAKLRRNSLSVLANHMRVDRLRDWRAVGVSESLLAQFLRSPKTAHQSCIRVTERVEAIAARHLDA